MKSFKFYKQLYFQVLVAIVLGVLLGHFYPDVGIKMKPFGDAFVKLIRMMVAPIIFTTVVTGIASMRDIKEVGRIGVKTLIYFELLTTFALVIGLIVANLFKPGSGMNIDVSTLDGKAITNYTSASSAVGVVDFLLNIIPESLIGAFTKGDILPVLFISLIFGFGILHGGERTQPLTTLLEQFSIVLFAVVGFIMKLAPIGAFGAIAYTIGAYGIETLFALSRLLACVYLTSALFIFIVLGSIARTFRFSLWRFLDFIKEEIFIVLGTSSSESVLPRMISKLEKVGCGKTVVGMVLPAGYTFNLDGTSIYLTIATVFIAQALNIDLTYNQQLTLIAVLLLTSKGAAAVTGGGFIVLAATLASMHTIPVEGVVLLLGVDRFMSEARAITNLIGNGVATIVIAKWENDFDCVKGSRISL